MITRLATRRTAVIVGAIELALGALTSLLSSLAGLTSQWWYAFVILAFLGVGWLVAYRRPEHPMGWMLLGVSGFILLSGIGGPLSILAYTRHDAIGPLGPVGVLFQPSWAPAITLLVLCILLYPDGKPPSPRWRWPVRWLVGLAAIWQLGAWMIVVSTLLGGGRIRLDSTGDLEQVNQPSGTWAWWGIVEVAFFLTVAVLMIGWVVAQARHYRRLTGERRVQQKWLLAGASLSVGGFVIFTLNVLPAFPDTLATAGFVIGASAVPIAIGIGILKYRLYDIDRVISRTVSYAIVTALLVGTFVGLVALTTDVLAFSSSVGVAASTLAAAALFNPSRLRVQHAVDRRFNRARYDAEATVEAFAQRLRDAVDLDAMQADLLRTVHRAVEPAHATVWIRHSSPFDEAPDPGVERVPV